MWHGVDSNDRTSSQSYQNRFLWDSNFQFNVVEKFQFEIDMRNCLPARRVFDLTSILVQFCFFFFGSTMPESSIQLKANLKQQNLTNQTISQSLPLLCWCHELRNRVQERRRKKETNSCRIGRSGMAVLYSYIWMFRKTGRERDWVCVCYKIVIYVNL